MLTVLYIVAFGVPRVSVENGYVRIIGSVRIDAPSEQDVRVRGKVDIDDRIPVRVEVVR